MTIQILYLILASLPILVMYWPAHDDKKTLSVTLWQLLFLIGISATVGILTIPYEIGLMNYYHLPAIFLLLVPFAIAAVISYGKATADILAFFSLAFAWGIFAAFPLAIYGFLQLWIAYHSIEKEHPAIYVLWVCSVVCLAFIYPIFVL